jgi:hypothetical protein
MSKLAQETVHVKLGRGPLQTGPDGLISHCIAHALYRQAPGDGAVWDLTVTFSPNINRPTTCVYASVCVVDMSNPNEPVPSVQRERICPQIFSITCLIDKVVIRGSIGNSPMPLALMLNMMICNRN